MQIVIVSYHRFAFFPIITDYYLLNEPSDNPPRMPRNYMSGAAKRKKEAAELEMLAKHSKVSSFFQSHEAQSSLQSDIVETQDNIASFYSPTDVIICNQDEQLVSLQDDGLPGESSYVVKTPTFEKISTTKKFETK